MTLLSAPERRRLSQYVQTVRAAGARRRALHDAGARQAARNDAQGAATEALLDLRRVCADLAPSVSRALSGSLAEMHALAGDSSVRVSLDADPYQERTVCVQVDEPGGDGHAQERLNALTAELEALPAYLLMDVLGLYGQRTWQVQLLLCSDGVHVHAVPGS